MGNIRPKKKQTKKTKGKKRNIKGKNRTLSKKYRNYINKQINKMLRGGMTGSSSSDATTFENNQKAKLTPTTITRNIPDNPNTEVENAIKQGITQGSESISEAVTTVAGLKKNITYPFLADKKVDAEDVIRQIAIKKNDIQLYITDIMKCNNNYTRNNELFRQYFDKQKYDRYKEYFFLTNKQIYSFIPPTQTGLGIYSFASDSTATKNIETTILTTKPTDYAESKKLNDILDENIAIKLEIAENYIFIDVEELLKYIHPYCEILEVYAREYKTTTNNIFTFNDFINHITAYVKLICKKEQLDLEIKSLNANMEATIERQSYVDDLKTNKEYKMQIDYRSKLGDGDGDDDVKTSVMQFDTDIQRMIDNIGIISGFKDAGLISYFVDSDNRKMYLDETNTDILDINYRDISATLLHEIIENDNVKFDVEVDTSTVTNEFETKLNEYKEKVNSFLISARDRFKIFKDGYVAYVQYIYHEPGKISKFLSVDEVKRLLETRAANVDGDTGIHFEGGTIKEEVFNPVEHIKQLIIHLSESLCSQVSKVPGCEGLLAFDKAYKAAPAGKVKPLTTTTTNPEIEAAAKTFDGLDSSIKSELSAEYFKGGNTFQKILIKNRSDLNMLKDKLEYDHQKINNKYKITYKGPNLTVHGNRIHFEYKGTPYTYNIDSTEFHNIPSKVMRELTFDTDTVINSVDDEKSFLVGLVYDQNHFNSQKIKTKS